MSVSVSVCTCHLLIRLVAPRVGAYLFIASALGYEHVRPTNEEDSMIDFPAIDDVRNAIALGSLTPARAKEVMGVETYDPLTFFVQELAPSQLRDLRESAEYKVPRSFIGGLVGNLWGNMERHHMLKLEPKVGQP